MDEKTLHLPPGIQISSASRMRRWGEVRHKPLISRPGVIHISQCSDEFMKTRTAACKSKKDIFPPRVLGRLMDGYPSPTGLLFRAETNISFIWRVCTCSAPLSAPQLFGGQESEGAPVAPESFLYGSPFIPTSMVTRLAFALSIYGRNWRKHLENADDRLQIIRQFYGISVSELRLMLLAIRPSGIELEMGMDEEEISTKGSRIPLPGVFILSNHPETMAGLLRRESEHYGKPFPEGVDRDFLDYSVKL